jgi:hypothetical protein
MFRKLTNAADAMTIAPGMVMISLSAIVFGGVFANVLANMAFALRALNTPVTQILRTRE